MAAAAMLSRRQVQVGLLAVAALVALMCGVAVAQQGPVPVPAFSSSPECRIVDKDVVKACFKCLGEGKKICMADRVGQTTQVQVDCCVVFGGHQCLCQMKKAWKTQGTGAQNNVQCVREKAC